jgi:hypothetical protein
MRRAISIGILVAFAAACFVAANLYFNPQPASALNCVHGSAHYVCPCLWQEKDDEIWLWDSTRTERLSGTDIGAPPTGYYAMWGDWSNGPYWVEGITYYYYWEDWRLIYIQGEITEQDVWFCYDWPTPDSCGN